MCFFKKKKRPDFDKEAIEQELKNRVERLETVVKGLALDASGEGELAEKKREAAAWGKKCIQSLFSSAELLAMTLPSRKKQQADVHQRRILQTLEEMRKELLDCSVYYAFLETRVYPLTQTLAKQLEELTTV